MFVFPCVSLFVCFVVVVFCVVFVCLTCVSCLLVLVVGCRCGWCVLSRSFVCCVGYGDGVCRVRVCSFALCFLCLFCVRLFVCYGLG